MQRRQLFEFNERPECPQFLRDSVTETLGTGLRWNQFGTTIGPAFAAFAAQARCARVLDLCSGTGEPTLLLLEWLRAQGLSPPAFVLSDLFPHAPALTAAAARYPTLLHAELAPVDATAVPATLDHDARTIINSFHHFAPDAAARIVADAVERRVSLFIYEGFPRDLARFLPTGPAMLPALLLNPLRAPRQRLPKALLTYLLPVIPMIAAWDGLVSVLRVYEEVDLRRMTSPDDGYLWDYREVPYRLGGRAVVFSGIPRERL